MYRKKKNILEKKHEKYFSKSTQILRTEMHVLGRCRKERKKRPRQFIF